MLMNRLPAIATALALAVLHARPVVAQAPVDEVKTFVSGYVDAFNKGDVVALVRDHYRLPSVTPDQQAARLAAQFDALRTDSFGKMTVYAVKPCMHGMAAAEVQVDFAYNHTFGGVMDPPGDSSTVFRLRKTEDGWRIVASNDLKAGEQIVCAG